MCASDPLWLGIVWRGGGRIHGVHPGRKDGNEAGVVRAAQQLATADPAGWRIGWRPWPAGMCENEGEAARFRRAAWPEAAGRLRSLRPVASLGGPNSPQRAIRTVDPACRNAGFSTPELVVAIPHSGRASWRLLHRDSDADHIVEGWARRGKPARRRGRCSR